SGPRGDCRWKRGSARAANPEEENERRLVQRKNEICRHSGGAGAVGVGRAVSLHGPDQGAAPGGIPEADSPIRHGQQSLFVELDRCRVAVVRDVLWAAAAGGGGGA